MTGWRHWRAEEIAYFREIISGNLGREEIAGMMNEKFVTDYFTAAKIKNRLQREHTRTGYSAKGRRCSPDTEFKPGSLSGSAKINRRDIGTDARHCDGYTYRKVGPKRYRATHVCIWEEAYGPVPSGMCVIFLDGDTANMSLDNLALISRGENAIINRRGLRGETKEITQAAIALARVEAKVGAFRRRGSKES
jgi:hypothetical protein